MSPHGRGRASRLSSPRAPVLRNSQFSKETIHKEAFNLNFSLSHFKDTRGRELEADGEVVFEDDRMQIWMSRYCGGVLFRRGDLLPGVPARLWDTADENFLNLVTCDAHLKLTHMDDCTGHFRCRMSCDWAFRMPRTSRTEPRVRIPGIRKSSLSSDTEESRVWREKCRESNDTIYFKGFSVFTFSGFELLQMRDFPFDRQILDLGVFEFVWRREKDTDTFEEEMKIVRFTMTSETVMPRWQAWKCLLKPLNEKVSDTGAAAEGEGLPLSPQNSGSRQNSERVSEWVSESEGGEAPYPGPGGRTPVPAYATRFGVKLRLQRQNRYYVYQIFLVTWLITVGSLMALGAENGHVGHNLEVTAFSLLSLISFKFSVAEHLPRVSYQTIADKYLQAQVVLLILSACWIVFQYRFSVRYANWVVLPAGLAFTTFNYVRVLRKSRQAWAELLLHNKYLVDPGGAAAEPLSGLPEELGAPHSLSPTLSLESSHEDFLSNRGNDRETAFAGYRAASLEEFEFAGRRRSSSASGTRPPSPTAVGRLSTFGATLQSTLSATLGRAHSDDSVAVGKVCSFAQIELV